MSAKIIDKREEEETDSFEDNQETPSPADDLPEKYRGKSPAELVQMHQEAEKLAGRHSQEVGELRKAVDDFILAQTQKDEQAQLVQQQQQPDDTDDEVDFFVDPQKAIERAVSKHPDVMEARKLSRDFKRTTSLAMLKQKHPDVEALLTNDKFHAWVKESPVRQKLFKQGDEEYDFAAVDELFTNFKAANPTPAKPAPAKPQHDRKAVTAASTGNPTGSSEKRSKKVYRRADVIRLKQTDPARYEALQPELMKAYREGRVR